MKAGCQSHILKLAAALYKRKAFKTAAGMRSSGVQNRETKLLLGQLVRGLFAVGPHMDSGCSSFSTSSLFKKPRVARGSTIICGG